MGGDGVIICSPKDQLVRYACATVCCTPTQKCGTEHNVRMHIRQQPHLVTGEIGIVYSTAVFSASLAEMSPINNVEVPAGRPQGEFALHQSHDRALRAAADNIRVARVTQRDKRRVFQLSGWSSLPRGQYNLVPSQVSFTLRMSQLRSLAAICEHTVLAAGDIASSPLSREPREQVNGIPYPVVGTAPRFS